MTFRRSSVAWLCLCVWLPLAVADDDYRPSEIRGLVEVDGRWLTIDEACQHYDGIEAVHHYARLRDAASWHRGDQLRMARWCVEQGLQDSAEFHYQILLQLEPRNKEARQALGVRDFHGMLLTDDQIQEVKLDAEVRKSAVENWKSTMRELRRQFQRRTAAQREAAAKELLAIDDVKALPAVEAALSKLNREAAVASIQLAAKFESQDATDMLARQAVVNPFPEARQEVAKALKGRSYFSWVPTLLALMEAPVEVHARTSGTVGPSFALTMFRRGPFADELTGFSEQTVTSGTRTTTQTQSFRVETQEEMWDNPRFLGESGYAVQAESGLRRANLAAAAFQQAELHNQRVNFLNQRVAETLAYVTDLPADTDLGTWYRWWYDYNDYAYPEETPLVTNLQYYSLDTLATNTVSMGNTYMPPPAPAACFLAGTPVTTKTGIRPIESIRIGDFVLAQDVASGELAFKPVTMTTFGNVTMMYRLRVGDAELYATSGHPFWVIGTGWKKATELKPGDELYTLKGPAKVSSVEEWGGSTTHNLVVADYNNYFVGQGQILAHDITIRRPTSQPEPGVVRATVAQAR